MDTKVLPCGCTAAGVILAHSGVAKDADKPKCEVPYVNRTKGAEYQDAQYGKGMRLHNLGPKKINAAQTACCTVCGITRMI